MKPLLALLILLTGIFRRYVAYRSTVSGMQKTPYPVMWNIEKAAR